MAANMSWRRRALFAMVAAALLIAGMTLPGLAAPNKTMTFQVNSTGPTTADFNGAVNTASAGTTNVSFWIRATNTTPGTGNPNSLQVTAPTGFVITDAVVLNTPNSSRNNLNATKFIPPSGAYVDINGIAPLQNGLWITVQIFATTPAGSCPGPVESNDWKGQLWSGTPVGSGQPFSTTGQPPGTNTTTTLTSTSCATLEFVTEPQDAATGTKITGTDFDPAGATVQVAVSPSSAFPNGTDVTITEDGPGSIVGDGEMADLQDGFAEFPGLQINTAGEYNLTATVDGGPSAGPVAITITPTGVCPDGVSGQEDFATPDPEDQGTLNISELTSTDCVGLDVSFEVGENGAQQWNLDINKFAPPYPKITGYATWTWDLTGTGPIPWTQISWKVNVDDELVPTEFVNLPRCNADAVTEPMPDPTLPNTAYSALFPTVPTTTLGNIPAGACMFNSTLEVDLVNDTYTEAQQIAVNEDLGGRKG